MYVCIYTYMYIYMFLEDPGLAMTFLSSEKEGEYITYYDMIYCDIISYKILYYAILYYIMI